MAFEERSDAEATGSSAVVGLDWLAICRRITEAQREVLDLHATSVERTVYEGQGVGGDQALVIDRRCEDAAFTELEALSRAGHSFAAVSEERGEVWFGPDASSPTNGTPRIVIDPIDGSLNARRTIPSFSLSIAVASGPTMADVEFGYVYDHGARDEFVARRGAGATLNGAPIDADAPSEALEVVGIESANPAWMAGSIEALRDSAYRLRAIGSIAITLSYVGALRLDGMLTMRPCRSVDAAAAQLIAREGGARVSFAAGPLDRTGLGLDERYQLAGARSEEHLNILLDAQAVAGPAATEGTRSR